MLIKIVINCLVINHIGVHLRTLQTVYVNIVNTNTRSTTKWERERERARDTVWGERWCQEREKNIQIDNLLVVAVAFIFVFLVIAALKIQTATPCHPWQTHTIDQWTWVRMTWHTRHARIKKTNTVECVGTELSDTTLMPYPASLARRSSEETHQKDW